MSQKAKRKRCASDGCRKLAMLESELGYCSACQQQFEDEQDPFFGITRLTEVEAEKWGRMDAEMRNLLLSNRIKQLEHRIAEQKEMERRKAFIEEEQALQRKYLGEQEKVQVALNELAEEIQKARIIYETFTLALAKKYDVDAQNMSIDPDTGIIREIDLP